MHELLFCPEFYGHIAGGYVTAAFYLAAIGYSIYMAVRGPSRQEFETTGPRVDDSKVTPSTLGTPKPICYGTVRIGGNIIWCGDLEEEIIETELEQSGGKGGFGGGGGIATTTSVYAYYRSVAIAFAEGSEDNEIIKLFANGKLVFDRTAETTPMHEEDVKLRWHMGSTTESVDPTIEAAVGTDDCPAYRGTCYAVLDRFPLADYGNMMPNFTAVITFNPEPIYPWEWLEPHPVPGSSDWAFGWYDPVDNYIYACTDDTNGEYIRVDLNTNTFEKSPQYRYEIPGGSSSSWGYAVLLPLSRVLFVRSGHQALLVDPLTWEVIQQIDYAQSLGTWQGCGVYASLTEGIEFILVPHDQRVQGFKITTNDNTPYMEQIYRQITYRPFSAEDAEIYSPFSAPPYWDTQHQHGQVEDIAVDRDGVFWCVGETTDFSGDPDMGCIWRLELVELILWPQPNERIVTHTWVQTGWWWIGRPTSHTYPPDPVPQTGFDLTGTWGGFTNVCYNDELHQLIIRQWDDSHNPAGDYQRLFCWDIETESIVWNRWEDDGGVGFDDDGWPGGGKFPGVNENDIMFKNPYLGDLWLFQNFDSQAGIDEPLWQIRMSDGTIIKEHDRDPFEQGADFTGRFSMFYHGPTHSFINSEHDSPYDRFRGYLDRATGEGVGLDTVVSDLCVRAGLSTDDIDVTELSIAHDSKNLVRGFRLTRRTTARNAIETLTKGYFFDGVESDFELKFLQREDVAARETGETIPEDDLGVGIDVPAGEFLEEERVQDEEIPVQFDLRFINPDIDWQEDGAVAQRILSPISHVTSQGEQAADLPIVFTATEARRVAERWLAGTWSERVGLKFTTLPKWLRLDPTDIFTIVANNVSRKARLLSMRIGESFDIEAEAVVVDQENYAVTDYEGAVIEFTPQEIAVVSSSYLIVLDIPLLMDAHDSATAIPLYLSVRSNSSVDWPGGIAQKSYDLNSWTQLTSLTSDAAWGTMTEALGDWTSDGTDTVNTVQVKLRHSGYSLTSITETELLNNGNPAMIGTELVQFQNATDLGDDLWELDTFLRGRRGTEWAKSGHSSGERFTLLTQGSVRLHYAPLGDLNVMRHYRGVTLGRSLTSGHIVSHTTTGVALKPYAPANVGAVRDSTANKLLVYWTRRSRTAGEWDWTNATEMPLGEVTEAYEVDLLHKTTGEVEETYSTTGSGSRQTASSVTFSLPGGGITRLVSTSIDESLYTDAKLVRVSGAQDAGNNGTFLIDAVTATQLDVENASGVAVTDTTDTKVVDEIGEQVTIPNADLISAGYTGINDSIDVVVYQISAVVGRGYGTSETV
jgi:hypothetical protein